MLVQIYCLKYMYAKSKYYLAHSDILLNYMYV